MRLIKRANAPKRLKKIEKVGRCGLIKRESRKTMDLRRLRVLTSGGGDWQTLGVLREMRKWKEAAMDFIGGDRNPK